MGEDGVTHQGAFDLAYMRCVPNMVVAAPMNEQRFDFSTPCNTTGTCADCKSERCICNQILITRNGRGDRIKFILVGEDLGL